MPVTGGKRATGAGATDVPAWLGLPSCPPVIHHGKKFPQVALNPDPRMNMEER